MLFFENQTKMRSEVPEGGSEQIILFIVLKGQPEMPEMVTKKRGRIILVAI